MLNISRGIDLYRNERNLKTMTGPKFQFLFLCLALSPIVSQAWVTSVPIVARPRVVQPMTVLLSSNDAWNGQVVSNTADGSIKGCSIQPVGTTEPVLEWIITIDGYVPDYVR